jgi:hypothetical protein
VSLIIFPISDTMALIDSIVASRPRLTPPKIYLQGYGLGGKVALITGALDSRVTGVSASAAFAPLRAEESKKETEGLRHYSHIHGLMPRLGFFLGNEERVPIDYDEIIAAIAPRPVQIVAPTMDRHAPIEAVRRTVAGAARVYASLDKANALTFETPDDFNRYPAMWTTQVDWVTRQAGFVVPPPEPEKK